MTARRRLAASAKTSPRQWGGIALLTALLIGGCTASSQLDTHPADSSVEKKTVPEQVATPVDTTDKVVPSDTLPSSNAVDTRMKVVVDSLRRSDPSLENDPYFNPVASTHSDSSSSDMRTSASETLLKPGTPASPFGTTASSTSDSTSAIPDSGAVNDSLTASTDSLTADSLTKSAPKQEESDLDTSIVYSGDDIRFDVQKHASTITGNAKIIYKDMTLTAHEILVDWNKNLMTATPAYDTLYTDSTNTVIDTIEVRGMPTFIQGGQTMTGTLMRVNMKTKEGYVEGGRTDYGDGYYHGIQIQKVSDEVLYVKDGAFTSCDLEHPHYSFTGSQMKMIYKERVVGKPVVLRFGDVPVFFIPFGVFSIKPGRHSGILIPTYGDDSRRGRHLRNLGYYWAASEYWDLETTLDFYEKAGVLVRSNFVYNKRYLMSGGVSGSYSDQTISGARSTSWDLRVRHNQNIDQYTKLRVDGTFVSGKNHSDEYYDDPTRRLKQNIRSNATLTKSWPTSGASMSLNLSHTQNLVTEENSQTLPSFSFRLGTKNLFPSEQKRKSTDKSLLYEPPSPRKKPGAGDATNRDKPEERWYNSITWSYSNRFENRRDESRDGSSTDLSLPLEETYRSGVTHSLSLNAPQKLFKYFNLTPSIRYNEDWFNERRDYYYNANGLIRSRQERGFFQRRTLSSSMTANTKLYGFFNINRGSVQAVRHVLTPSVSLSFRPDYSDKEWGYYEEVERTLVDTNGVATTYSGKYDRYSGSIFGGTSSGKQLSIGTSLNNLFQMKRVKINQDGEEEEIKNDLFTYNLSTNYNFAADSMKFGRISGSFRADPISGKNAIGPLDRMNIQVTTTHSFYQYDQEAGREVDRFYWDESGHGLNVVRMTNFETSSSFSLSGKSPFGRFYNQQKPAATAPQDEEEPDSTLTDEDPEMAQIREDLDDRFKDPVDRIARTTSGKPWRVQGSIRYNLAMNNPIAPKETIRLQGSFTLQLTTNWQFQYSTSLDLQNREVVGSNLIIKRDLHCWEGSLRWSPQGIGQGFFLRIGIKSPTLRDVKIEQQRGRGSLGF